MKSRGWALAVISMELRRVFSYRVDFWFNFFGGAAIYFVVAYFLWTSMFAYAGQSTIGGYTQPQLIFYFFLVPFFDRIIRSNDAFFLSHEIYEGGLTKYLLYPLSVLNYKYVTQIASGLIGIIQFGIIFLIFTIFFDIPSGVEINFTNTLMAFLAGCLANALNFVILNMVEMFAFWVDNVWSLSIMVRYIMSTFGGYIIPISFFPEWSQGLFQILPFGYIIGFPVQTMMGNVSFHKWCEGMGMLAIWLVLLSSLAYFIWQSGLKRYSGVGQ